MTQRILTSPAIAGSVDRPARTISFGTAINTVLDTLLAQRNSPSDLPGAVLRDRDPALHDAVSRLERTRSSLDALHRPLLY